MPQERPARWRPPISFLPASWRPTASRAPTSESRVGAIGVGGRASLLLEQLPDGRTDRRPVRLQSAPGRRLQGQEEGRLARLPGLSQDPGTQRHRRGDRGHGRIPAGAALHPRLPGRQGHLRRKAVDPLYPRRARAGRRRAEIQSHLPGRHAAALDGHEPDRLRTGPHAAAWARSRRCSPHDYPSSEDSPANGLPEEPVPAGLDWDVWLNQAAMAAVQQRVDGLDALVRLRRRRSDQLGRARNRSDSVGARHGRDRPGGNVAPVAGPERQGRDALCQRRAGPLRARITAPTAAACSSARRASWRSTATSSPPTRRKSPSSCSRRSTRRRKRRSGATRRPCGRPNGTCRTGSIASARGRNPWPTSRSAIGRSACRHLVNITRRLGRRLQWDPAKEQFVGDDEANKLGQPSAPQGLRAARSGVERVCLSAAEIDDVATTARRPRSAWSHLGVPAGCERIWSQHICHGCRASTSRTNAAVGTRIFECDPFERWFSCCLRLPGC